MSTTAPVSQHCAVARLPRLLFALGCLLGIASSHAYPPALPHTIDGMLRDELGNPVSPGAVITLESDSGVKVYTTVAGLLSPGVNYRLSIPLDAGLTSDAYRPTALNPAAPFKIRVKVGTRTFLPIEMTLGSKFLGEPGMSTRMNLTLGEDRNNDGLPDAWQRRINPDISKVQPGDDPDHDGLTNMQEYLAGTYALDPKSGFVLTVVRNPAQGSIEDGDGSKPVDPPALLEFTGITGRSYTVFGSPDLTTWQPVRFRLVNDSKDSKPSTSYAASSVSKVQVRVVTEPEDVVHRFFKLVVE